MKESQYKENKKEIKASYKTQKSSIKKVLKEDKNDFKVAKSVLKDKYHSQKDEYKSEKKDLKKLKKSSLSLLKADPQSYTSSIVEVEQNTGTIKESEYINLLTPEIIKEKRKTLGLPSYSHGEELFNAISHIVGGGLGLIGTIVGIIFALQYKGKVEALAMAFFGFTIIFLYTMSSIYHFLNVNKAKKVFQVLDHCTIYVLIFGTYVPMCLIILNSFVPWNYILLAVIGALTTLGIVLNATMMDKFPVKVVSNSLYLLTGWAIICFYPILIQTVNITGIILIIAGGVSYTLGAILYGIGSKKKYFHSMFHLFVLAGTLLQYFGILLYGIIGL